MPNRSFLLFRLFRIRVQMDWSWFILAVLVTVSLAYGWFPFAVPGLTTSMYWTLGVVGAIGLFFSIVIHEFCHAIVGRRYGMRVDEITLFLFGGVAKLEDEPARPGAEALMAIAGPLASLVLALLFFILAALTLNNSQVIGSLLAYFYSINLIVAVFNMIPAYPLDGGRVLRAVLWKAKRDLVWATRVSSSVGQVFGFCLIGLGIYTFFTSNFVSGVWLVFLGLLLTQFARASYLRVLIRRNLHGRPAAQFMNPQPATVTPNTQVSRLVAEHLYQDGQLVYPVVADENRFVGCVDIRQIHSIPEREWPQHAVQEIMQACGPEIQISPEVDAEEALTKMAKTGSSQLMVVQGNQLVGVLSRTGLLRFMNLGFS